MDCKFEDDLVNSLKHKLSDLGVTDLLNSWTVVAAIFALNTKTNIYELISFGSGVKCVPDEKIRAHNLELVHDLHAETICRRSFIIFLYKTIIEINSKGVEKNTYIHYDAQSHKYLWNADLELIFYSSQSPCGDSSIKLIDAKESSTKKVRISKNDIIAAGRETDQLGILRTKPGRIDSPFSSCMSCSDKICLWNAVGVQGALLSQFIKPVYFSKMIFSDEFNLEGVNRAFINRVSEFDFTSDLLIKGYKNQKQILISHSLQSFFSSKPLKTSDSSSFWHVGMASVSHLVQGFKKGSKRPIPNQSYKLGFQSPLSREYIYETFFKQLKNSKDSSSYFDEKINSIDYQIAKKQFLSHGVFRGWLFKDDRIKECRKNL